MKKVFAAVVLTALVLSLFTACSGKPSGEPFDPEKAFERLRTEVRYEAELEDAAEYAGFVFGDALNGGEVKMYQAGGKLADALMFFKLKDKADMPALEQAVKEYLDQCRLEADRYNPSELTKLDNAVVYSDDIYYIVCITADSSTAREILK